MAEGREFDQDEDDAAAGDPAAAFDALRRTVEEHGTTIGAEMRTIRQGVEAAFEEFDKARRPQDYSTDLGRIVKALGQLSERLQAVEQSPILRQGAEPYTRALEDSGTAIVRVAVKALDRRAAEFDRIGRTLTDQSRRARERRVPIVFLGLAVGAGLLVGSVMTLFLPAMFPFSAAPRVAALVMRQEPWEAGMKLMKFASAEGWSRVASADELVETNRATVSACREAAAKTKRDQKCPITVAAPAQ